MFLLSVLITSGKPSHTREKAFEPARFQEEKTSSPIIYFDPHGLEFSLPVANVKHLRLMVVTGDAVQQT